MSLSNKAAFEIHELALQAKDFAASNKNKEADVCLARIAVIRETGESYAEVRSKYTAELLEQLSQQTGLKPQTESVEMRAFRKYMNGREAEMRDFLAGTQSISYTQGASGGYLIPQELQPVVVEALAQTSPLLDEKNVSMSKSGSFQLRPYTVAGYDLTGISAVKVGEGVQQTPQATTFPTVSGKILNGYTYRCSLAASLEFEEDSFFDTMRLLGRAYGVAMARGIGADLVNGNGGAPSGLLTGAANSNVTTGSAGVIVDADIESVYFSVDRVYRQSPKCAWVMNDAVYEMVRKAKDSNNRPLINVIGDVELLHGKPILIEPNMPSTAGSKGIVFGDLSHFYVRLSGLWIQRVLQVAGGSGSVNYGEASYIGRQKADSVVFDPGTASSPVTSTAPIVYATLHS